jgi:hypothetical protein
VPRGCDLSEVRLTALESCRSRTTFAGPLVFINGRTVSLILLSCFLQANMSSPTRTPFTALNGVRHIDFVTGGLLEEEPGHMFSGLPPMRETRPAASRWSFGTAVPAANSPSPSPPPRRFAGGGGIQQGSPTGPLVASGSRTAWPSAVVHVPYY